MADYLTFENNDRLTIKVNGNTVSSGYELQEGDVITATVSSPLSGGAQQGITINNTDIYTNNANDIDIYDESIYISYYYLGGGASN